MKSHIFTITIIALILILSGCITQKGSLQDMFAKPPSGGGDNSSGDGNNDNSDDPNVNDSQYNITMASAIKECKEEVNEAKGDSCLMALAKERKSETPCKEMTLLPIDKCYFDLAIETESEIYCIRINEDTSMKNDCFKELAKSTNDELLCNKIQENQKLSDECFESVATENDDGDVCANIFDPQTRDYCYISVVDATDNYELCNKVSVRKDGKDYLPDKCRNYGKDLEGELCAKIISDQLRAECFEGADNIPSNKMDCNFSDSNSMNNCNYWYATNTGDLNYCFNLNDKRLEECMNLAIEIDATSEKCATLPGEYYEIRNECYKNVAISELDSEVCSKISKSREKEKCIMEIAVATEESELCYKTLNERDLCLSRVALELGDYTICEKVGTDQSYYKCFAEIAMSFGAPEICSKAERTKMRKLPYAGKEYCYEEYAINSQDTKTCEKISYSSLENSCIEIIETCVDGDGECDEDVCDFTNDNDCKSPNSCTTNEQCNDYKVATEDSCIKNSCKHEWITECINDDKYCPTQCTYDGDPEAEDNVDSDCLAPCEILEGEVCLTGFVCDSSEKILAKEPECCNSIDFCVEE